MLAMSTVTQPKRAPRLPPRWFIRLAWVTHRTLYSITGGRFGLRTATPDRWGTLRVKTVGRRSGQERIAIVGFVEDGPNLVTLAMNGWASPEPAWWLNLQAHPDATVELPGGVTREVTARAATEAERPRLWALCAAWDTDRYAGLRSGETSVVVLEPRAGR
jgi:F420H(2)-dependent quinone reductase